MKAKSYRKSKGMTFVETMAAMVILLITLLGAMGYRYFSTSEARGSDVHNTAARLGLMLIEGWKGYSGDMDYAPETVYSSVKGISISTHAFGPPAPTGFKKFGNYHILSNDAHYYATLSYKDATLTEPQLLNVEVSWITDYKAWGSERTDYEAIKMSTYADY
ncbi:MAG: type IV pilus modification PilV family protein [Planctomycetota bacterium]|jgi:hypothetical protein